MKAVAFYEYGGPEVLQLTDLPKPSPGPTEVLIKICATTVTAEDPKMRAFNHPPLLKFPVGLLYGFKKPKKPVLGMEFAGTVQDVGEKVSLYKPGDEVFGYTGIYFGAYAEYMCMPESGVMHIKPRNLSCVEAASLVNGPLSALAYIRKKARIKQNEHILIYGASGSVGTAAVQLARYFGARVTAVCSTKNLNLVKSLGADQVIDYTQADFARQNEKYDIIFDTVGKTSMKACMKLLKPKGRYLLTDFSLSQVIAAWYTSLAGRKKIIALASNMYWKKEDLNLLKQLAEKGIYKPTVDKVFPLEDIRLAHNYVESGHKSGNVCVLV